MPGDILIVVTDITGFFQVNNQTDGLAGMIKVGALPVRTGTAGLLQGFEACDICQEVFTLCG